MMHDDEYPTIHFTVSAEQKARLQAILRLHALAKARGNDFHIHEYQEIISPMPASDTIEDIFRDVHE